VSATRIEWATHTDNPAGGCAEARLADGTMDPACVHCYARLQAARVSAMAASQGRTSIHDGVAERRGNAATWTGVLRWDRELLRRQFAAMRPGHRTFVGSMTDLWHPSHDPGLLVALAEEIRGIGVTTCPDCEEEHSTQEICSNAMCGEADGPFYRGGSTRSRYPANASLPIVITLTKRADRLLAWQRKHFPDGLPAWHWAGVTAGCQQSADERIPLLLQVRSAGPLVLSAEPLTGPLDLAPWLGERWEPTSPENAEFPLGLSPTGWARFARGLGWVIGPKARPMHPAWVRALRDQCTSAGVPFFFKQHGAGSREVADG